MLDLDPKELAEIADAIQGLVGDRRTGVLSITLQAPDWHLVIAVLRAQARALRAEGEVGEKQGETADGTGWFLPRSSVNDEVATDIDRIVRLAKQSHTADLWLRYNAENHPFEADWVKYLRRAAAPCQYDEGANRAVEEAFGKLPDDLGRASAPCQGCEGKQATIHELTLALAALQSGDLEGNDGDV